MHATRCKRFGAVNVFRGLAIAAAVAQNAAIGDLRMSGPIPEKRSSSLSATSTGRREFTQVRGLAGMDEAQLTTGIPGFKHGLNTLW